VKNHNPFAVNDVIFAKLIEYDWRKMNTTGCSLVWGHPQGPTLTGVIIEALAEAASLGVCSYLTNDIGGYVRKETPLLRAYEGIKAVPNPDVLVFNANQCRDVQERLCVDFKLCYRGSPHCGPF
jgi:hypothetical protein